MDSLEGKHAVVTGGASGIGRAFARRFLDAGMNVTIADIEEPALDSTVVEFAEPDRVLGFRTDVSRLDSVQELAAAAGERFGAAHVLCLNAGVAGGAGRMENLTIEDWQWTLGVNLYGVIHGLIAFLGPMKEQDEGHVVITASVAGLTSYPGIAPYNLSKHGAVSIAESLHAELVHDGSNVGVSCLCPGLVLTGIFMSDRNRPEQLTPVDKPVQPLMADETGQLDMEAVIDMVVANAQQPADVAELVHDAILEKQFWIYTDDHYDHAVRARLDAIGQRRLPETPSTLLDQYMEG